MYRRRWSNRVQWSASTKRRIKKELLRQQKGACVFCGFRLTIDSATIEHMTPLSRNGGNGKDNLGLSCAKCNADKGSMTASEFKSHLGDTRWYMPKANEETED